MFESGFWEVIGVTMKKLFQMERASTEKARFCLVEMRAKGT